MHKKVFKTKWFSIEAVSQAQTKEPYYWLVCGDSVSILAKTKEEKIVMIRQYRAAIDNFSLELSSGYIDKGEKPIEAIKRELKEETGYTCGSYAFMGTYKIAPSRISNTLHMFFGQAAVLNTDPCRESQSIELVLVSEEEFIRLIETGRYKEVAGIAMFYLAKLKKLL